MSIFDFFSRSITEPKSYEEAFDLSYKLLIQHSPKKAIKVIKSICKQDLPVKKEDIFFVYSIACLALRPIFRELEAGKLLLEKVVSLEKNNFDANSILFSLFLAENDIENARKYAKNLLESDYRVSFKQKQLTSQSKVPEVRDYLQNESELFQQVSSLFLNSGEEALAIKAAEISREINPVKFKDDDEFITALFENSILQTRAFVSKVQNNLDSADKTIALTEDLGIIALIIISRYLSKYGLNETIDKVFAMYENFIRKNSGTLKEFEISLLINFLLDKSHEIDIVIGDNEKTFSEEVTNYIYLKHTNIGAQEEIKKYSKQLATGIKISMIHFGVMDKR